MISHAVTKTQRSQINKSFLKITTTTEKEQRVLEQLDIHMQKRKKEPRQKPYTLPKN